MIVRDSDLPLTFTGFQRADGIGPLREGKVIKPSSAICCNAVCSVSASLIGSQTATGRRASRSPSFISRRYYKARSQLSMASPMTGRPALSGATPFAKDEAGLLSRSFADTSGRNSSNPAVTTDAYGTRRGMIVILS